MGKRIWIVNYYTGNPDKISNPRYTKFAHYFVQSGYEVITFNANHIGDENTPLFERKQYGEYDYVHVKAPHYKGNGLARMKSIFYFAWTINKHCKEFERPDVILHNIHTPFDYPIIWAAKKLNAKYIAEAWDAWPDVFAHLGLLSYKNPLLKFFYYVEKKVYQNADNVVFTFEGGKYHIQNMGWSTEQGGRIDLKKVYYINNGVDLEQFDKDRIAYPRKDTDLNDQKTLKIVYLGSINRANHVLSLIEAAKLLQLQNLDYYRFFIYGNGADREELEKKVRNEGIKNVVFKEKRIPLCEVAWVVSQATVNIMNYQKGFGYMGVSSGKLFQYLAAGKPIVCNIKIAYDDVISRNNLGVAREIDTPEDFVQAICSVAEQPKAEYDAMCKRVRKTAEKFDFKVLAAKELMIINEALANE